jgi:hypothetical protein
MGLWSQGAGQFLDCGSLANSFAALDAVIDAVIGSGVVSGLVIEAGTGATILCTAGVAIAGHVVHVPSSPAVTLTLAAGTWDIWLCQPTYTYVGASPVAGSYPNSSGVDTGVLTSVAHGTTPAAPGALLATVVSTGSAISSVNTNPTGRNVIPGPAPAGSRIVAPAQANFTYQPSGSTTTAFVLVETPVSDVTIYKNGLLIDPTQYIISGTNMTFGTAPLSTDKLAAGFTW